MPGLAAAMTIGGLTGMYSTAMFGWAGVPNALGNWLTLPGFVIRANSAVIGNVAGQAAQGAVKFSSKLLLTTQHQLDIKLFSSLSNVTLAYVI